MLRWKQSSDLLTVYLRGEIDHCAAEKMRMEMESLIKKTKDRPMVLDFSEVTFVDSSGIAVVINAMRCMTQIEGKLLLTGLASQPMRVFRASGIDKLVEIKEAVV